MRSAPPKGRGEPWARSTPILPSLWEGIKGRASFSNEALDCLDNSVEILSHLAIRKTNDLQAVAFEPMRSTLVVVIFEIVVLTVDLNDKPRGVAVEVDDERADSVLPPKPDVANPLLAKLRPQQLLRRRQVLAQVSGMLVGHARS